MAFPLDRALFAGLSFDKAKYRRDIELFQTQGIKPAETQPGGSLNAALDFFGSSAANQRFKTEPSACPHQDDKKKKKRKEEATVEQEDHNKHGKRLRLQASESQPGSRERNGRKDNGKNQSRASGRSSNLRQNGHSAEHEVDGDVEIFKPKRASVKEDNGASKHKNEEAARIEAAALLRKRFKIRVTGQDVPAPLEGFSDLMTRYKCKEYLLRNMAEAGYKDPTPIQRQALPVLLSGRECFACAPTGSGKTMAFLIPMLMRLKARSKEGVRGVVLCPTRELALQTSRELKKLTKGKKFRSRIMTKATSKCLDFAASPCDILISTPLRLNLMLKEGKIDLSRVQHLILDESDKLFEMGFVEQIDEVIAACSNPKIVRSLFSATLPESVEELTRTVMQDPVRIVIGERNSAAETVNQRLMFVGSEEGKLLAVRQMFQQGLQPPVLVFVQSKERAKQLYKELAFEGVNVDAIHADRTQAQREAVVDSFRSGKTWVLIATDVMARGMDFKGVACVVNYDFPQSTAAYIHRIGRSGRAGRPGEAVTLYTEEDAPMLRSIANVMVASGCEVPSWMLSLPKQRRRRAQRQVAPRRKDISTAPKYDIMKAKKKKEMIEASKRRKQKQQQEAATQGRED